MSPHCLLEVMVNDDQSSVNIEGAVETLLSAS